MLSSAAATLASVAVSVTSAAVVVAEEVKLVQARAGG
jgi:hypothetical protein